MKPLKEFKKNWIVRAALVVLFLFFGFTSLGAGALRAVEFAVGTAISPVADTLGTGLNYVGEGANSLLHVTSLSAENKRMKKNCRSSRRRTRIWKTSSTVPPSFLTPTPFATTRSWVPWMRG